jgi:hypothetical protein
VRLRNAVSISERSSRQAITALDRAGIDVLACREERSEIETAFLSLTEDGPT